MNWRILLALGLLVMALSGGVALAGENDANLCSAGGAWEGNCTSQRDWEAGWCYANNSASVCDNLYSDVSGNMPGGEAESESAANSSAANQGATAQSETSGQSQQAQQNLRTSQDPCPSGFACAA